jgi:uncharacterized Zn-binding protein involved in type VI secretion
MKAGRVGDEATRPHDAVVCPKCKTIKAGPSTKGSPDVFINGAPALRVGDKGELAQGGICCGKNTWRAATGSSTVTLNGMPITRVGDEIENGGKIGRLITGSSDVDVGSGGFGARSPEDPRSLTVTVTDAFGRALQGVKARVLSPDGASKVMFDGTTNLSGLHKGSTVIVEKTLQRSKADPGAVKGLVPFGTRMVQPKKAKLSEPPPDALAAMKSGPDPLAAVKAPKKAPSTGGVEAPSPQNAGDNAPNGTSSDPGGTSIPGPDGGPVKVVKFTVYNWVQAVYRAFRVKFPKASWKIAILGVREASMLTGAGASESAVARAERLAAQGKTSAKGGSRKTKQTRVRRKQSVYSPETRFDDTLYVVWTPTRPNKKQKVEVFECTIDPQVTENPNGQPYLLEGREYEVRHTMHKDYKYGPNAHAFRVLDKGKPTITLLRTKQLRYVNSADDTTGIHNYEDAGINIHFWGSGSYGVGDEVGAYSSGCTVLRHGLASKRYQRFAQITLKCHDPGPYLVVSSKYVRLYHEWVAYCDGDPVKAKDPKSVLKMGILKNRALNGKYISSLLDVDYAKANPSRAKPLLFRVRKRA